MGLFSKKSSAPPQRVTSHVSTLRAPVRPTENAFVPDGGGNIDYGAAMANHVAAESRQQIAQKQQKDKLAKEESSSKMQESINLRHALTSPGSSIPLVMMSVRTLIHVDELGSEH